MSTRLSDRRRCGQFPGRPWRRAGAGTIGAAGAWTTVTFLNGMLYVLRVNCLWRGMHERYCT
jgi:hypothetical protein